MGCPRLALVLIATAASVAAGELVLSGRFESRLSSVWYRSGSALSGDNSVRLMLDARPGTGFTLESAVRVRAVQGANELDLTWLMPVAVAESLPDSLRTALLLPVAGGVALERAFVTIDRPRIRVRVGRQPLAWGVGFLWNPTEVLPAKSWLDPTYERDGEDALRLEWLGPVGIQAIALPGPDLPGTAAIGRVTGNRSGFDWALTGWRRPGPTGPTDLFIGGQFKGEILLPGVWCEGGYHPVADDRPGWWELITGADYTLPSRTWMILEYRHNSAGSSGAGGYPARHWLEYLLGGRTALGRDQLYAALRQPVAGFSSLSLGGLVNLGDRSAVVLPGLHLNLADNADFNMFGIWSLGGSASEHGAGRARCAVARFTLHF